MNIILNETVYAKNLLHALENPDYRLHKKPSFDLRILSRYLCHVDGLKPRNLYETLVCIMEMHYHEFNIASWQNLLLDYAKDAKKKPMIMIDCIPVTQNELQAISQIKSKPLKRVAFTMLCLAKYKNLVNENNHDWIHYDYKEIFKAANVTATVKEQCRMIHELRNLGYLHMNKIVDNLSLNVRCIDHAKEQESVLEIRDFRNLGYEYLMYCGEKFFRCNRCGLLTRKTATNNRYCKDCSKEVKIEKDKCRMEDIRNSRKQDIHSAKITKQKAG